MLPLELLRPIIEEIDDKNTICSLLLTSKAFHHDAERRLYHTPNSANPRPRPSSNLTHVAFLSTITTNPRLAYLVHTYILNDVVRHGENPLWDLVKLGLRAMVNLKVLQFRAFGGHPSAEILDGCSFQLQNLQWGSHSDEVAMKHILPQQPKLRDLYLECHPPTIRDHLPATHLLTFFADDCCPDLLSLAGNKTTIELLLPRRNIRNISWVPGLYDLNDDPIPGAVTRALGGVEILSLGGYFMRPSLATLVDHLAGLRVLEIVGLINGEEELEMIQRLPNLRELVISLQRGTRFIPLPSDVDRYRRVQQLFAECRHLQLFDFVHSWLVIDEIWYERWKRGDARPTMLLSKDVHAGRFLGW